MKTIYRSLTTWAGLALLISVTYVSAQDWPQWRGVNRDGKTTGFKAPQKWLETLTQKWKVTVGTDDATPALANSAATVTANDISTPNNVVPADRHEDYFHLRWEISPSKTQYEQLAQFKVSENPIYAHPIPTGNKIIVKDSDTVTLWAVE